MNFAIKEELESTIVNDSFVIILFEDNGGTGIDFVKNNKLVSKLMFKNNSGAYIVNAIKKRLNSNPLALDDAFACLKNSKTADEFIFNFYTSKEEYHFNISQIFGLAKMTNHEVNTINHKDYTMTIEIFKNKVKIGQFKGEPLEGKFFFKKL